MPETVRHAVFVHGAGAGGWEWGIWSRVFEAGGLVVTAPDLQPAAAGLAATSLTDYAAQVDGWIRAARASSPGPVIVVGASLGGLLALICADAADALVLINPMPPSGLPTEPGIPGRQPADGIVPWGRRASLAGTRRAIPEADPLAAQFAFRRWRDESARVMQEARAGVALPPPRCPVLVMASRLDEDVPMAASAALAADFGATFRTLPGSHVAPLLGAQAGAAAVQAVEWLNTQTFTS